MHIGNWYSAQNVTGRVGSENKPHASEPASAGINSIASIMILEETSQTSNLCLRSLVGKTHFGDEMSGKRGKRGCVEEINLVTMIKN